MKRFLMLSLAVGLVGLLAGLAYAGTLSTSATVNAIVTSPTLSISLDKDATCTALDAAVITLVKDTSYPAFMIAPSRADMTLNKNWHFVQISASAGGVGWKLEVYGTNLTGGGKTITIDKMRYWYSGTWAGYSQVTTSPLDTKTESNKWDDNKIGTVASPKKVYNCVTDVVGAKSYMQYQLDIASASAATYAGQITYKVTEGTI